MNRAMADGVAEQQRIVVGVDGSAASEAALRWAADEAVRRHGKLQAVIAWRPSVAFGPPAGPPPRASSSLAERAEDAELLLDTALSSIGGESGPVEVERRVMRGSPHRVLADAADGASMLVIGGRAGKLAGKLPWSTGRQVVHDASCPVVVVPPEAVETQASAVSSSESRSSPTDS